MIFLDANFLINFYVKTNKDYERANELMEEMKNKERIISNLVIMEVITVMNVKLKQDHYLVSKVYKELNENYKVIIDNDFYGNGFEILTKQMKKNKRRIPLFDSVYIALMRELGIKKIATFDNHFDNIIGIIRVC
ncbi:tRNA(fMet)-specific endonuclease VapC [Methanobrevibacter cuticularis]|uniref:tRNA(FMet)-specific endonuclease VapC n=1 Tax=Methanobrevibacter cuticularis TaxID=47311 RepID=A0A166FCJ6_9EURY|nr:type II toxin-antitoxin system VapC family toxin [Methanobrevibacter cuticularis]KZX17535.1 tRNA(fMet)-specific endonuclease VapC [Methanobrevibacter cuticularis]